MTTFDNITILTGRIFNVSVALLNLTLHNKNERDCFGISHEKFSSVAYVHLDKLLYLWNVFSIVKRKTNWWTYPCAL